MLTLEQSVAELHQMFLDFALLTEQQGELLYQIEYQVRSAADYIEDANVDVHEAIEYQKKIRKKQWCVRAMNFLIVMPSTHSTLIVQPKLTCSVSFSPFFEHKIQLDHPHCHHSSHHCAILNGSSPVAGEREKIVQVQLAWCIFPFSKGPSIFVPILLLLDPFLLE